MSILIQREEEMKKKVPPTLVPTKITCHHCTYTWYTKSKMEYTNCPNCGYKVRVKI